MIAEATVEEFPATAFTEAMAGYLVIDLVRIRVQVEAASVLVTTTISAESSDADASQRLTSISQQLESLDSATASEVLGVAILSIRNISLASSDAAEVNAVTESTLSREAKEGGRAALIYGVSGAGLLLITFVLLLLVRNWRAQRRMKEQTNMANRVAIFIEAQGSSHAIQHDDFKSHASIEMPPAADDGAGVFHDCITLEVEVTKALEEDLRI